MTEAGNAGVTGDYVCGYLMEFTEGPPERKVLYEGTRGNCDRLAAMLDDPLRGFPYDGDRTPTGTLVFVCEAGAADDVQASVSPQVPS
jgi:hypothetical protein